MAHKAKNISYLDINRKSLPILETKVSRGDLRSDQFIVKIFMWFSGFPVQL